MIKLLVCGGREYNNKENVFNTLDSVLTHYGDICILQGGAKGADALAKAWAKLKGVACFQCDANWDFYDKRAGSIRNRWMLNIFKPDLVLAFAGGKGTADMVKLAKTAGVVTYDKFEGAL